MLVQIQFRSFAASRRRAVLAAVGTLVAVLALGGAGPAVPGLWELASPLGLVGLAGLPLVGGAGLLAWHFALLAGGPRPCESLAVAALPAALLPAAAIPGIGAIALLVTLAIAGLLLWQVPMRRGASALAFGGGGAGLVAAWTGTPMLGALGSAALFGAAWMLLRHADRPAANDNPSMERVADFWRLPPHPCCATQVSGNRIPGHGE